MQDWLLPAALVVAVLLALLVLLLVVLVLRFRRRVSGQLDAARREAAELREQVAGLAAPAPAGEHQGRDRREQETAEYVITDMPGAPTDSTDSTGDGAPPGRIEGRLFADIVLRESLLKAAAATHGVRRALAPETRNRIRFEMRREVKRSRKERRADLRAARRLLQRRAGEQEVVGTADEDAA